MHGSPRSAVPGEHRILGTGVNAAVATSCSLHSARMCIRGHPFFVIGWLGVVAVFGDRDKTGAKALRLMGCDFFDVYPL